MTTPTPRHTAQEVRGDESRLDRDDMTQWFVIPAVQANLARRASGSDQVDWISDSAHFVAALGRPARALSLGSGFGLLERQLITSGTCATIHGIDISPGAVEG